MTKTNQGFLKNVTTLAAGTGIAQVITILVSPVLSRLFTPEDFALFAAFTSIASLFSIVATGKYELAIILPDEDRDAAQLLFAIILLVGIVSIFSPLVLIVLSKFSSACNLILSNNLLVYFIVFVFCSANLEALRYYFVRIKQFKAISCRTILGSIITVFLNVIGGWFFNIPAMFVISTTIAQVLCVVLFAYFIKKTIKFSWFNIKTIKMFLFKYRKFPFFTMPGQLLNSFTGSLPILVLPALYSQNEIGQFAFVQKIVGIPMTIIGGSVAQVFFQKFSSVKLSEQKNVFVKTFFYLFIFITVCAIPCVIVAVPIFNVIFGAKWLFAAKLAQILAPMYIAQFAVSNISGAVYIINGQLKIELGLQILRLVLVAAAFFISFMLNVSFVQSIIFFSIAMIVWYLSTLIVSLMIVNSKECNCEA
ncbi:MAG: oligosaccharide flippase family protein [Treponema phagedenis]|uniref:oligosaccharide flippase family protein n=1 Tax=Treponema phagedenis TaxID=162 RepID=UPI003133F88B